MSSTTQLDQAQVIKKVYDDNTGALNVIQKYVETTILFNGVSAAVSVNSDAINVLPFKVVGVMANWAGLNTADATLQFQGSMDTVIWDNVGSATTLVASTGHQSFSLIDEPYQYVRLVYTHGTNTSGTLTVKYILRA